MMRIKGLCLLVVMTVFQGCSVQRPNLIETGALRLDVQASEHVHVHWVRATQEASGVTVTGLLEHQDDDSAAIKVHVDVTLRSSTGEVLGQAVSEPVFLPSERTAHVSKAKPFSVTLPVELPENALVEVKVHYADHGAVSE